MNSIVNINSLLNLTTGLYRSDDEGFILNSTLLSLMGKLKIVRALVYHPSNNNSLIPIIIKGSIAANIINYFEIDELIDISNINEFSEFREIGIKYLLPIKDDENYYALICLGKSLTDISLSKEEQDYVNLISTIAANAIRNAMTFISFKQAKVKVEQRNQLLSTLFEISKDFSQNFSADGITKTLALNLMGQLTVTRFAVFTIDENKHFNCIVNRFAAEFDELFFSTINEANFAQDITKISAFDMIKSFVQKWKIQVVSPMIVQGNLRGFLIVGQKMNGAEFSDENLLFIEAVGNSAIAALENERLFKEELDKKRLESELNIALEIQRNLLPERSPALKRFEICGTSIPSRHVGGDLYDFIRLDENRVLIAIADVSGKGIPASLIMANFQAALRLLSQSEIELKDVVERINLLLFHNTSADKFVTAFFCIIDDENSKISYINAGHNPPFLLRKNKSLELLSEGGLILGFMEETFGYLTGETYFEKDDLLVLYTDGVTEADNGNSDDYGEARLQTFLSETGNENAVSVMNSLIDDVKNFLGNSPQNDDITLVVIKGI